MSRQGQWRMKWSWNKFWMFRNVSNCFKWYQIDTNRTISMTRDYPKHPFAASDMHHWSTSVAAAQMHDHIAYSLGVQDFISHVVHSDLCLMHMLSLAIRVDHWHARNCNSSFCINKSPNLCHFCGMLPDIIQCIILCFVFRLWCKLTGPLDHDKVQCLICHRMFILLLAFTAAFSSSTVVGHSSAASSASILLKCSNWTY